MYGYVSPEMSGTCMIDIYIIKSIFVKVGMEHEVYNFYKFSVTASFMKVDYNPQVGYR